MRANTALRLLSSVMEWSDEIAQVEFAWLQIMARLKYDDYRDFLAGMRFLESLVAWLQQFEMADRPVAYEFVRKRLVFVSAAERQRLVELLYPAVIWPELVKSAVQAARVPSWRVLVDAEMELNRDRRSTLFLALSDGARLDTFRHANVGRISNEQVVGTTEPSKDKWFDLLKDLRKDMKDPQAHFTRIVLVDDFTASGTSLLRKEDGKWKGKLPRFLNSVSQANDIEAFDLLVHHLIGTPKAEAHLGEAIATYRDEEPETWSRIRNQVVPTFGWRYPKELPLTTPADDAFITLTRKYYDEGIESNHTEKGGEKHLGLGYAKCALPLVLDHNTPNNSVALLWAESEPDKRKGDHSMRPLFRRRQRHS